MTNTNMEPITGGIKAALTIFITVLTAYIPIGMLAAANLTQETTVELKTVASVAAFGGAIIWWLSKKFQKIDDRLESLENQNNKDKDNE